MYLFLDTSTPECRLWLYEANVCIYHKVWQADRELARLLLHFLKTELESQQKTWIDIAGISVFEGPGSFTGLRIGMAVLNAIASTNNVPIVTERGENWREVALKRLERGETDEIALPFYGRPANVTTPKK